MSKPTANVNSQQLARQFSRGDVVVHVTAPQYGLRVLAVWDGIGMVDVLAPAGQKRIPVEELSMASSGASVPPPVEAEIDAPPQWCSVSRGQGKTAKKLAQKFVKEAIYWRGVDRKYRRTKHEQAAGVTNCPRCCTPMKKTRYKRREGISESLYGCPECLFLIKELDLQAEGGC